MTQQSQALEPCPFCGQSRVYLNAPSTTFPRGSINCPACMVVMPGEVGEAELIETWNRRALGGTPAKQGEALDQICHDMFHALIDVRAVWKTISPGAAEKLDAAIENLANRWHDARRAALSQHPVAVAVKPLTFEKQNVDGTLWCSEASVSGMYRVNFNGKQWIVGGRNDIILGRAASSEEAISIAQQHHAACIRSALIASPVPAKADGGVTEAVNATLDREERALLEYRDVNCQGDDSIKRHAWTVAGARLSEVRVIRRLLAKHALPALSVGLEGAAPQEKLDVDALVARLTRRWEDSDEPTVKKINRLLRDCREAAAALRALAAPQQAAPMPGVKELIQWAHDTLYGIVNHSFPAPEAGTSEPEPVAWQRYSERTDSWSHVDADHARTLAAGGEVVRPLYAYGALSQHGGVTEALSNLITDVQKWVDAVRRDSSWESWDHHYKGLAYGKLDSYRLALQQDQRS